jgi:DNA-binding transcriptional MerR regulator
MSDPARLLTDHANSLLYIGKLAALTGATRKAIRHYEAVGLLPAPGRRGSYRVYTGRDVFMVHVIKHAQSYGFSLSDLRDLVAAIGKRGNFPLKQALAMVERKRAALRREAAALRQLDRRLVGLMRDMRRHFG